MLGLTALGGLPTRLQAQGGSKVSTCEVAYDVPWGCSGCCLKMPHAPHSFTSQCQVQLAHASCLALNNQARKSHTTWPSIPHCCPWLDLNCQCQMWTCHTHCPEPFLLTFCPSSARAKCCSSRDASAWQAASSLVLLRSSALTCRPAPGDCLLDCIAEVPDTQPSSSS